MPKFYKRNGMSAGGMYEGEAAFSFSVDKEQCVCTKKFELNLNMADVSPDSDCPRRTRDWRSRIPQRTVHNSHPVAIRKLEKLRLDRVVDVVAKKCIIDFVATAYFNLKSSCQSREFLPINVKNLLCESLVLSQLHYCDTIYDACLKSSDKYRIKKLQSSCLRLVYGIRRYDQISHKLKDANWLHMKNRRMIHSACLYYSVLKSNEPQYLFEKVKFRTEAHKRFNSVYSQKSQTICTGAYGFRDMWLNVIGLNHIQRYILINYLERAYGSQAARIQQGI
nr:unnamed protein product [Callosobruchus analis]